MDVDPAEAVRDPARLAAVDALELLDAGPQASLERFTRMACAILGTPVSLVSLIDRDRQYFPAITGLTGWAAEARETPLSHSFCQYVVADGTLVVEDAREHPVLKDNGAIEGLGVTAYLGVPLVDGEGYRVGTLCAIDAVPRAWDEQQLADLEDLAAAVSTDLRLRTALARARDESRRDALTGLGNRRALVGDLDRRFAEGSAAGLELRMFDLDGFKAYNDLYGHPAGDDLLRRLGARLREAAAPHEGVYRLGGDEFCVVVPAQVSQEALCDALTERAGAFTVTTTSGTVALGREARTTTEALALADRQLYRDKHRRPTGSAVMVARSLRQTLAEHDAVLDQRADDVGELAVAVAHRLGLTPDQVQEVRLTAWLHDIGTIGLPDPILAKPGPLDDDEWRYVRKHTLIGERIVAASPALADVGPSVRSSHERWDGGGYPDGLRAEEIPLTARIVAACGAFDAMTSRRPYREERPAAEAVDELRACAGTQFDPAVVEAVVATVQARAPAA